MTLPKLINFIIGLTHNYCQSLIRNDVPPYVFNVHLYTNYTEDDESTQYRDSFTHYRDSFIEVMNEIED